MPDMKPKKKRSGKPAKEQVRNIFELSMSREEAVSRCMKSAGIDMRRGGDSNGCYNSNYCFSLADI